MSGARSSRDSNTRRSSQSYRDRDSATIVQETRGVPFKIFALIMCVMNVQVAIRNFFWCDKATSGTDYETEVIQKMFPNCTESKYVQLTADLVGVFELAMALARYHMAMAEHVSDVYLTAAYLTFIDTLCVIVMLRMGDIPFFYSIMAGGCVVWEGFIFLIARRAYRARLKMKKHYEEEKEE